MSLENGGGANAANRRRSAMGQSVRASMSGNNTNNALAVMAAYAEITRKREEALELVKGLEKKVRVADGPTGSTSSSVAMAAATARRSSNFQGASLQSATSGQQTFVSMAKGKIIKTRTYSCLKFIVFSFSNVMITAKRTLQPM